MATLYPTPLKRIVDNQWEVWKDQVLYELFDWHHNIWNPDDTPMPLSGLLEKAVLQNLGETTVNDICRALADEGLVEIVNSDQTYYRLKPVGIDYVQKELTKARA